VTVDFTGIWNANLAKSKLFGPPPKSIAVKIKHSDPELQQAILLTKLDGSQQRLTFQCSTNGDPDKSRLNDNAIRGHAGWQGNELVIETWVQAGTAEMYFRDCWSISPDGQTLSMEHRNDALAGQITVLERAG
jgi:hypothetical protein